MLLEENPLSSLRRVFPRKLIREIVVGILSHRIARIQQPVYGSSVHIHYFLPIRVSHFFLPFLSYVFAAGDPSFSLLPLLIFLTHFGKNVKEYSKGFQLFKLIDTLRDFKWR